jgi:multiple antibiotic resistance protein
MEPFFTLFMPAFVTLFVVIDPPGCAPIFASLTQSTSAQHRRQMAVRATFVATLILLAFAFGGKPFLGTLGISLDAFRVAGGLMLFLIAIDMVFEKRTERRENRAQEVARDAEAHHLDPEHTDVSVFPMAMPMIAGPGSIASLMLLMSQQTGNTLGKIAVISALGVNLVMTLAALLMAGQLMRLMGKTIAAVVTRLLGVILAALAAQIVIDGLKGAFAIAV